MSREYGVVISNNGPWSLGRWTWRVSGPLPNMGDDEGFPFDLDYGFARSQKRAQRQADRAVAREREARRRYLARTVIRYTDSGGIDGGLLLAFAVIIAVVLVYVAAGGAR